MNALADAGVAPWGREPISCDTNSRYNSFVNLFPARLCTQRKKAADHGVACFAIAYLQGTHASDPGSQRENGLI